MIRLFKTHLQIFNYLRKQVKTKRSMKDWILWSKNFTITYCKVLLEEYKYVLIQFDQEYRKKKKEYNQYYKIVADLKRALILLKYIDKNMEKKGVSRQQQRQFWRDFVNDHNVRKDVFAELMKSLDRREI